MIILSEHLVSLATTNLVRNAKSLEVLDILMCKLSLSTTLWLLTQSYFYVIPTLEKQDESDYRRE